MSSELTPKLNALNKATGRVPQHAKQNISDLPKWAKLAMARTIIYDETYKEAAAHYDKSTSSLEKLASSPAGKKWRAQLSTLADDPVFIAEALIRSNAAGVTFDAFWALEAAKGAQDYKEAGVIARDLMDRIPELRRQQTATSRGAPQIVINMGGDVSLEPMTVETHHSAQIETGEITLDAEIVEE